MTYVTSPKDFSVELSRGRIQGMSTITKFGYNDDVDTGSFPEDLWSAGGLYVAPTAARVHNFVSTSVLDTAAGTGARTILIRGIDGSYNAVSETITLNGLVPVASANSYFHVHLAQVTTAGVTGANQGSVSGVAAVDLTTTINIPVAQNQSVSSIYMVPVNYKGYIMRVRGRMNNSTSNSTATIALYNKPFGGVFQLKTQMGLNNAGSSFVELDYTGSCPFIVQAKSLTKLTCTSVSNNNTTLEGEYDLILVAD